MNYEPNISNDNKALAYGLARAQSLGLSLALHEDLDSLKDIWRSFEIDAVASVFQHYDFLASWMKHIGMLQNIQPLIVTGHEQNGRLGFILPFGLRRSGPFRILEWLGASVGNYQSGLYSSNLLEQLNSVSFKVLWRDIKSLLPQFDCLFLQNQPELLEGQDNPFGTFKKFSCPDNYYDFALGPDFEALFATKRSPKSRRTLQKRDQKFDELGEVTFSNQHDASTIISAVDAVLNEKNKQLARIGRKEKFPEAMRDLFLELCQSQDCKPSVFDLFLLQFEGKLVAASINAIYKDTICGIVLFMFKGEFNKYSPGDRLMRSTIKWACENGLKTFDLSLGRMPYKLVWADRENFLFDTIQPQNPLGMAFSIPTACMCSFKHMIKRSDKLTQFLLRWSMRLRRGD